MKAFIKIFCLILACVSSLEMLAQSNTKVTGELKGLEAGTEIYLSLVSSPLQNDSVVAGKGSFEFNLTLDEGNYYKLTIGKDRLVPGASISFYLQPGLLKIKGKESLLSNAELSGSNFADDQNDLQNYIKNAEELKKYEQVLSDFNLAWKNKDSARIATLKPMRLEWYGARKELYRKWFMTHPSSPVSAMVLMYELEEKDMEGLQKLLDHLHPEAKQNALVNQMQQRIDATRATAVGKLAPDFVQNDTSGKTVALKDFRGKYVLLDFWASWCVPCRRENPHIVKAYNRLKDKNFTVLGVSLDQPTAKGKWLKAIQDDQLSWTHVSDLRYWDNAVAKLYGIKSIPANLLIGPDGVILAKNLRGEMLEELLKKYVN